MAARPLLIAAVCCIALMPRPCASHSAGTFDGKAPGLSAAASIEQDTAVAPCFGVPFPEWEFKPAEEVDEAVGPRLRPHVGAFSPWMLLEPTATFGAPYPYQIEPSLSIAEMAKFGAPGPASMTEPEQPLLDVAFGPPASILTATPERPPLAVVFGDPAPAAEFRPTPLAQAPPPRRRRATLGAPVPIPMITIVEPAAEPPMPSLATLGNPEPSSVEVIWLQPPDILQ
jgi:hypothetical protein